MTVHIVSVGRSLLDSFDRPDPDVLEQDLVAKIRNARPGDVLGRAGNDADAASAILSAWLGPAGADPGGLSATVEQAAPRLWPARISAELETFARVQQGADTVTGGDLAVLLATDTPDGLTAALWNAIRLAGGELRRVRYLATPDDLGRDPLVRGQTSVLLVRIPMFDATTDQQFRTAMRGIGVLGRALLPTGQRPAETFVVHLSGGFKAAVPYLIGLAEALRSLSDRQVKEVTAYALHETTDGPPIRVPLRRMNEQRIRDELKEFTREGDGPKPTTLYLDGYAYEEVERSRYRLTAFGEGLRALVGDPNEAIGN